MRILNFVTFIFVTVQPVIMDPIVERAADGNRVFAVSRDHQEALVQSLRADKIPGCFMGMSEDKVSQYNSVKSSLP